MSGGGGGSSKTQQSTTPVAPSPPPPAWANLGVNTQQGYNTLMQTQAPGMTAAQKGQAYNQLLSQGFNDAAIRSSADTLFGTQSGADWNSLVQQGAMQAPGSRPLPGSGQFYQPVYQQQYQNYGFTNPFAVSQYGQPSMLDQATDFGPAQPLSDSALQRISSQRQAAEADAARGGDTVTTSMPGGSTQTRAMFPSGMPQMQTPFSMFGGQMQGGGYGQYGENNPYSPYSNTFLNMPSNLNRMGQADKVGFYQGAMDRGFNDQQMYNQASGLFGYQSPQDWSYLQNQAMQMQSPFRSSGPAQPIVSRSAQARGTPNVIRRAEGGIASLIGDE